MAATKKSRSRHQSRRKKNSHRRRRNPGFAIRRPLGLITAGFKPSMLMSAGIMAAGAFLNVAVRNKIAGFIPATTSPNTRKWLTHAIGLGTSGLWAIVPRFGTQLATGAAVGEGVMIVGDISPSLPKFGEFFNTSERVRQGEFFNTSERVRQGSLPGGMREFATAQSIPGGVGSGMEIDSFSEQAGAE